MSTVQSEKQGVAKVQKTFYLNEVLAASIDSVCESSGASFTKIVTASVLCYLLGQPLDKKKRWMREAVALETRSLSLATILAHAFQDRIEMAQGQVDIYTALDDDVKAKEWRQNLKELKQTLKRVQEEIEGQPNESDSLIKVFSGIEL